MFSALTGLQPGAATATVIERAVSRRRPSDELKSCSHMFQLCLNAIHFKPDDIKVKVCDGYVVINAKHKERRDGHGHVFRQFTRRFKIPIDVANNTLECMYMENGLLEIKAAKETSKPTTPANDMDIPIHIQKNVVAKTMEEASA